MNVQNILTAAFYVVTISFTLAVIYCEMSKSSLNVIQVSTDLRETRRGEYSLRAAALRGSTPPQTCLQISHKASLPESSARQTLHQEQIDLNTLLEEYPTTSEKISHEPMILPPAVEEKAIKIAKPKILTLIKKELDLTNMTVAKLREECGKMKIQWRDAITDIKTGKKRALRKAEMVEALQQKLSA